MSKLLLALLPLASMQISAYLPRRQILSTLLRAGFSASDLDCAELRKMKEILVSAFEEEGGIIGFGKTLL